MQVPGATDAYLLNPVEDDDLPSDMDGKEFKAIREKLGLTQSQLADILGYEHAQNISDFERKSSPRPIPRHVAMLMEAFQRFGIPDNWPA